MKLLIIIATLILLPFQELRAQKKYSTTKGHISFYSKAPVSDVDAINEKVKAVLNTLSGELNIDMAMGDFRFKNKKMGRDAEGKYLETEKFKEASFKGKIEGKVDYDKPGSYPVTAKGKMKLHGTEKDIEEKGTVKVEKGKISLLSDFDVLLKDYKIDTPKILGQEMTSDKVRTKIAITLLPAK